MKQAPAVRQSGLCVRPKTGSRGRTYWDAQWRYRIDDGPWRQKSRRLGLAWMELDAIDGWRKRRGRCRDGWLDERHANTAALTAMDEFARELGQTSENECEAATRKLTVRELALEWLEWLAQVRGAKPSTLRDYQHLLRDPGIKYKRGDGVSAGRIMTDFGDRAYDEVTAAEVSVFLRRLDRESISARTVNKHRQVLSAIFSYACRADTYGLLTNPVRSTDKRREKSAAALDYYEVGEVEALASAVGRGAHRWVPRLLAKLETTSSSLREGSATVRITQAAVVAESEVNPVFADRLARLDALGQIPELVAQRQQAASRERGVIIDPDELAARTQEDRRDADAFRLLLFTGLRLGEVLALRWADVDIDDRLLLIRRAVSAGQETEPKGRRHRFVPLSTPAIEALKRLGDREDFIGADDYVLCNRYGRRLDASALRRRYKQGCDAAGLRPVKLHGLRYAAGSLVARTNDAVFVRDFLGHAKLATTDRYVSAKLRPEEFERLDRAFGTESAEQSAGAAPAGERSTRRRERQGQPVGSRDG